LKVSERAGSKVAFVVDAAATGEEARYTTLDWRTQ